MALNVPAAYSAARKRLQRALRRGVRKKLNCWWIYIKSTM